MKNGKNRLSKDFVEFTGYNTLMMQCILEITQELDEQKCDEAIASVRSIYEEKDDRVNQWILPGSSLSFKTKERQKDVILREICHIRREKKDGFDCPTAMEQILKNSKVRAIWDLVEHDEWFVYFLYKIMQTYISSNFSDDSIQKTIYVMGKFSSNLYSWESEDSSIKSIGERNQYGIMMTIFNQDNFFAQYVKRTDDTNGNHKLIQAIAQLYLSLQENFEPDQLKSAEKEKDSTIEPQKLIQNKEKVLKYFECQQTYTEVQAKLKAATDELERVSKIAQEAQESATQVSTNLQQYERDLMDAGIDSETISQDIEKVKNLLAKYDELLNSF